MVSGSSGPPALVSVIVTTFEWPAALRLALESLRAQDRRDFEVLVADDGSGPETAALIETLRPSFPVPLTHVWQADEGFRVAASRNRAVERSRGDYIVFLDGDCFVLSDFVSTHRRLAERGWFVSGKRSLLRPPITRRLLRRPHRPPWGGRLAWFARSMMYQCSRPFQFLPVKWGSYRYGRADDWRRVESNNFAAWRSDLFAVGGFDERYTLYGFEDSDLVLRLIRTGVRRKRGDHASVVLHLDHPRRHRGGERQSRELFEDLLASERTAAVVGLNPGDAAATPV